MSEGDVCRFIETSDGTTVRLRGNGKPLTSEDSAALDEVVAAVKARFDALPAEERAQIANQQSAARERNRARLARIRGEE